MIKQLMFIFNEEIVQSEHYSIQIYALCKLEMYKTKAKDFLSEFHLVFLQFQTILIVSLFTLVFELSRRTFRSVTQRGPALYKV